MKYGFLMKKIFIITLLFFLPVSAFSEVNYQAGEIKNLTATTGGIMVNLGSGQPDNCEGTPYGWLLIKQEHTALTSVVLAAWASGNKSGTVYTSGRENGTGYCLVNQFDPAN